LDLDYDEYAMLYLIVHRVLVT